MAGNVPNISRDSFDYSKLYDKLVIQQGVPIPDSDWNELNDVLRFSRMLLGYQTLGNLRLPASPAGTAPGYQIGEASAPSNNFEITAGWALAEGVLVPTVLAEPPTAHDYEDDTNVICEGTVTSFSDPTLTDTDKYWESFHDLVGCRVKMTSGVESGNSFTIATNPTATTITVGGSPSISAGDTYIIKPPALTTPGGARTDEVYLAVWWEDINENEDTNIEHPGLGIETCHRSQRRWCVRVAEGASTPATPAAYGFGVRYVKLAELARTATANILAAIITNENWDAESPIRLVVDDNFHAAPASDATSGGIGTSITNLRDCLDAIDNALVRRRTAITLADGTARTMADYVGTTSPSYINSIGNGGTFFVQKASASMYIPAGGGLGDAAEDPEVVGEVATGGHDGYSDIVLINGGASDAPLQGKFRRLHFYSGDFNNLLQIGYDGSRGECVFEDCGFDAGHAIFRGFSADSRPVIIRNVEIAPGSGAGSGLAALDLLQSLGTYPFIIFENCVIRGPHASASSQTAVLRIKDMGSDTAAPTTAESRLILFKNCIIKHDNITTIPTVLLDGNGRQIVAFQDCRIVGITAQTAPVFRATGANRIYMNRVEIEAPSGQALRIENGLGVLEDVTIYCGSDTTVTDPQLVGIVANTYREGMLVRNMNVFADDGATRQGTTPTKPMIEIGGYDNTAAGGKVNVDGLFVRLGGGQVHNHNNICLRAPQTMADGGLCTFRNIELDARSASIGSGANIVAPMVLVTGPAGVVVDTCILENLTITDIGEPTTANTAQWLMKIENIFAASKISVEKGSGTGSYGWYGIVYLNNIKTAVRDLRISCDTSSYKYLATAEILYVNNTILDMCTLLGCVSTTDALRYVYIEGDAQVRSILMPVAAHYEPSVIGIYVNNYRVKIENCRWDCGGDTIDATHPLISLGGSANDVHILSNYLEIDANSTDPWISGTPSNVICAHNILRSTSVTIPTINLSGANVVNTDNLLMNA